jgi:hypothetical protein
MFYINTGNFFGGINVSGLNYVQKIRNYNNRVFLKQADISGLEFRDSSPSDDPNSKFSAYALQLGTGISKKFTFGDLGFMFSYVSMGIYDQSSSGFSMDLGYSKLFKNGAGVGISILNLGYMSKLNNEKPKMPTEILIGFSKNIEIFRLKNKVYSTIEFLRNSSLINYKVGADINLSNYNIMTGYAISDNVSEFSIGGGLNYGRLEINYAVKFGSQEIGEPKIFSISYRMP